jgi:hypothetical protein
MFLALLLAAPAFGQDQAADPRTAAGCGPAKAEFDVKTDKNQHSAAQPESGKALVYVIEDVTNPHAMTFGTVTTRVGLDGNWVGANHGQSYISFAAEPGEHRVCVDWQSSLKGLQTERGRRPDGRSWKDVLLSLRSHDSRDWSRGRAWE